MKKIDDHGNPNWRHYSLRRKEIIKLLGGRCVQCGTKRKLEIDHKDPKKKKLDISRVLTIVENDKLKKELKKCQLLCHSCHMRKTVAERGQSLAKGTHGTLSSYRYCKCQLCIDAHKDYCAKWHERKKEAARKRRQRNDKRDSIK